MLKVTASQRERVFWVLLLLFFLLRLPFLTRLPIFNDEAIYLDWAWRQLHFPGQLFFSLHDGKPPLLLWLFGLSEGIFPDPLTAGRVVSVLAGSLTLLGIFALGKKFFNFQTAFLASVLYALVPLFVFFDRQALLESATTAVGIWIAYFLLQMLEGKEKSGVLRLGLVLGLGLWLKTSALVFWLAAAATACVWWFKGTKGESKIGKQLLGAFFVSQLVSLPLYLQRAFWLGLSGNSRYALTFAELLAFPWQQWWFNLKALGLISFWQLTPPIWLAGLAGVILLLRKGRRPQKMLVGWLIYQLAAFVLVTRQPSARYLVVFLPPWLILASFGLSHLWQGTKRWLRLALGLVLTLPPLYLTLWQIWHPLGYFNFLAKLTPYSQKENYVTGWPSGYGVSEARRFLEEKAAKGPIIAGVRLDSGNPENAILVYFYGQSGIKPIYLDAKLLPDLSQIDCLTASLPVYFVSRDRQLAGLDRFLQEEIRFYKPEKQHFVGIYQLKASCEGKTLGLPL